MDMHHMGMKVGFGDEFHLEGQAVSCGSSTGSFSSASTSSSLPEPFTPTSGRSTPGIRSLSMDHDAVAYPTPNGFDLTPPSSAFGGYFPQGAKADIHRYMDYNNASPSPSRKSSMQSQSIDFDYAPSLSASYPSLSVQEHGLEHPGSHSMGHYSFGEYATPPQFPVSTNAYHLDNSACDASSMWAWTGHSPVSFFARDHPSASPSPSLPLSARERNALTPSYLASHGKRRVSVDKVQQKTSALQKAQDRHGVRIERIAAATFKCNFPNCPKGPFKRQEHLKRHKNTKHADDIEAITIYCRFCDKPFNRRDNYRQHLRLHTRRKSPTRRTDYFPEAQALLDEEISKTKQRSQLKKKTGVLKNEDY
ncbi:hypothetical protein F4815DRAFT_271113 [Daldinia loculata]|nr:hypothetical protein F4815DRAFT_271113 [Daldinia loculata]